MNHDVNKCGYHGSSDVHRPLAVNYEVAAVGGKNLKMTMIPPMHAHSNRDAIYIHLFIPRFSARFQFV